MSGVKLAAVVLTLNEEHNIVECLSTLKWADEMWVFDSYSTDRTVELAEESGARVAREVFENYAQMRNLALSRVDAEWVLFVDADERVTRELSAEIQDVLASPDADGYWIPRHNYIFGRLTRGAGWYPDYQMRLLRRERAHYDPDRHVHEVVILDGREGYLKNPLVHYNYDSLAHFIAKQERYTDYDARVLFRKGVRPKPRHLITAPIRHFIWRFFTLKGYVDGFHGLKLSVLMAWYEYQKQLRLRRLWREADDGN